jgi:hypothetical protein
MCIGVITLSQIGDYGEHYRVLLNKPDADNYMENGQM